MATVEWGSMCRPSMNKLWTEMIAIASWWGTVSVHIPKGDMSGLDGGKERTEGTLVCDCFR